MWMPGGGGQEKVLYVVVSSVLIPPKNARGQAVEWDGEELSVEDFKQRFDPLLDDENLEL